MEQSRQGESPQQPGNPSNQWSGPGGPEKQPPAIPPAAAEPQGPFKAVARGTVWSVVGNGTLVYIVSGREARELAEFAAVTLNTAWKLLGVPDLLAACKALLPFARSGRLAGESLGEVVRPDDAIAAAVAAIAKAAGAEGEQTKPQPDADPARAAGAARQQPGRAGEHACNGRWRMNETNPVVTCCITCGRPVPSELIAARVMKPAQLTRRDLSAASNEFAVDVAAAEDVIDPHAAPPRRHTADAGPPSSTRHWYETPAPQDGTPTPGPAAANGDAAAGPPSAHECPEALEAAERIERERAEREDASDVETPPLAVLGQGEYARTIPASAVDAEWFAEFVRRRARA